MVLRAKGGEIRRHQQRIKQSINGGGDKESGLPVANEGNHKNIAGQSPPPPPQ